MATGAEYMNATPHHSKVRVSLALSSPLFVAGEDITGKMEMESRAEKEVGIGLIMVELFAVQELNSRDHSATSTFLHSRRLFQGNGLPPSNAVNPQLEAGDAPVPPGYYPARRGKTTFFFRFPTPLSSPSSISFASGLAKIRYEVRASVGVAHRGEKRLVTSNLEADLVQCQDMDGTVEEHVVVGENGKMYVKGRVLGGRLVVGEPACLELQVRNHTPKKTTGLQLSLTRNLKLLGTASSVPVELSDSLYSENFRGSDYSVHPGSEGVARLVFNVPKASRVVKGGIRESADDSEGGRKRTEPLFELRCILGVKIGMGIGSKDVIFEMPVQLSHRAALREAPVDHHHPHGHHPYPLDPVYDYHSPRSMSPVLEPPMPFYARSPGPGSGPPSPSYPPYMSPHIAPSPASPHPPYSPILSPQAYPLPASPRPMWSPPPPPMSPIPYYLPDPSRPYYYPPPPVPLVPFAYPTRPSSAGPQSYRPVTPPSGLPGPVTSNPIFPPFQTDQQATSLHPPQAAHPDNVPQMVQPPPTEPEEGKGERASRISRTLHTTMRARSVSPTSHRFPVPAAAQQSPQAAAKAVATLHAVSPKRQEGPSVLSPRPLLSPRASFSNDLSPISPIGNGTTRSDNVDLLEKLVEPGPGEEGKSVEEVLKDLEKAEKEMSERDKSLPGPPVPSGKPGAKSKFPSLRDVFALDTLDEKTEGEGKPVKSVLRPSPIARRISNQDLRSTDESPKSYGFRLAVPRSPKESTGLDALEQRLLKEVGTRKPEAPSKPTIFDLGLAQNTQSNSPAASTPALSTPNLPPEPITKPSMGEDSEISSFVLASNASTEQQLPVTTPDLPPQDSPTTSRAADEDQAKTVSSSSEKHKERKKEGKSKDKESEVSKLRKEAKGRVADWLDGLSTPTSPNQPSPFKRTSFGDIGRSSDSPSPKGLVKPELLKVDQSPTSDKVSLAKVSPSKPKSIALPREAPSISQTPPLKSPTSPTRPTKPEFLQGRAIKRLSLDAFIPPSSPPPISPKPPALASPRKIVTQEIALGSDSPVAQSSASTPRPDKFPDANRLFPPSSKAIPETKYDVRSARGGRGGIATAVAAIWSSMAEENNKEKSKDVRPPPVKAGSKPALKRPAFLDLGKAAAATSGTSLQDGTRPSPLEKAKVTATPSPTSAATSQEQRNLIKSTSVPATVDQSFAKPHLSSTASLARSPLSPAPRSKPPSISPLLESTNEEPAVKPPARGETAFGQARLKDLIKKYQEAASSTS